MITAVEPEKITKSEQFPNVFLRLYFEGCRSDKIVCISYHVADDGFIESFGRFCVLFETLIAKSQNGMANKTAMINKKYFDNIVEIFRDATSGVLMACDQKEIEIDEQNDCKIIWQIEVIKDEKDMDILGKEFTYKSPKILNIPIDSISRKSLIKFVRVYKDVAENIDFYTAFIGVKSSEDDNDNAGNKLINAISLTGERLLNICMDTYKGK